MLKTEKSPWILSTADSYDSATASTIIDRTLMKLVKRSALSFLTSVTGYTTPMETAMKIQRLRSSQAATWPKVERADPAPWQLQSKIEGKRCVVRSPMSTTYPIDAM